MSPSVVWALSQPRGRPGRPLDMFLGDSTGSPRRNAGADLESADPELSYVTGRITAWRPRKELPRLTPA